MQIIARPIGFIVKIIYDLLSVMDNPVISAYAMSIIVASILLKLVLFPLTKKQTDAMKKMQELSPMHSWTAQICQQSARLPLTISDTLPDFELPMLDRKNKT